MKKFKDRRLLKPEASLNILKDLEEERDKVKRSSKEWSSTFNAMTDMISVHDRDCVILKVNKAFADAFKGKPEDFVGKKCYDVVHHTEEQIGMCPMKETLKTRKPVTIEIYEPVLKKYLEISTVPFFVNGDKEVETIVHTMRDITERKKSEGELINERDMVQRYLDLAGVMIIGLNQKGEIILMNKKGAEILETEQEEIIGKNWFDNFLPKRIRKDVGEVFNRLMKGKNHFVKDCENPVLTSKGKEKLISWHNTLLKNDKGKVIGFLSSGEDVTEKRKVEREMELSNELLDQTGEIALVGGWELDAKTFEGTWTDQVAKIYDLDPEDKAGLKVGLKYYSGESRPIIEKAVQDAIKKGVPYDLELRLVSAKGVAKWVRTMGEPVFEGKKIVKLRGIFQDITEKKKADEELLGAKESLETRVKERTADLEAANKELKSLDVAKSDFLNIS